MTTQELFNLAGKTAVVTGGSGGLGSAMARGLAQAGARVAIVSSRAETGAAVAQAINDAGGTATNFAADITDASAIKRAAAKFEHAWGPADILVNGAGGNASAATTSATQSFFQLDAAALAKVFNLNLMGAINASQAFGQSMAQRKQGVIINIGSMAAERAITRVSAYGAAKAALDNFTRWLAVHMAQEYSAAIRVNAIAPGFFLTEQNRFLLTDKATGEFTARAKTIVSHTPMARLGKAEDLLGALLWLASPASEFVTGIVVPVDGGFSAWSGV